MNTLNDVNTLFAPDEQGLTQREAATRLKKSLGWVNRLVADGTLTKLPNGRIDPASLPAAAGARSAPAATARNTAGQTSAEARAERDHITARMAALDYAQRVGQVTAVADVEAAQTTIARQFRDGLLALPALLAPSLINIGEPRAIEHALRRAFIDFLTGQVAAINDEPATPDPGG